MLEKEIEAAVVKHIEGYGGRALKLRIDGLNGFPDRTVFLPNGKCLFIEFKTPEGNVRPAQRKYITTLESLRQDVHIIRSVESGIELIESYMR